MLASPGQSLGSRHFIISLTQTAITRGPHLNQITPHIINGA